MADRRRIRSIEPAQEPERTRDPYEDQTLAGYQAAIAGLQASAKVLTYDNTVSLVIPPREWQEEAWSFYNSIGEINFAVGTWFANCVSRVRLIAATRPAGADEPVPLTKGPAAQRVANLAGGISGQSAMLKRLAVHFCVPGESYLVLENTSSRGETTRVYSSSEIRIAGRGSSGTRFTQGSTDVVTYEVMTDRAMWRPLSNESLVCRIWNPDDQFGWAAQSIMRAALPIAREIDFYNRYIIAILLSRLANNGMLLWPAEAGFPANANFADQPDPMMAELIDIATKAIANPGSAAAAMPMPVKISAEYIDKVRHVTFATEMSQHVLDNRIAALKRLATTLNMPTEVLTGMGDLNHWGQWQLEESAIKTYIVPPVEMICAGLNTGWFVPTTIVDGEPLVDDKGDEIFLWYDTTELQQPPDKSVPAQQLQKVGAINDVALRRETGFTEEDKPSMDELKQTVLTSIAMGGGADAMKALSILTGDKSLMPEPAPAIGPDGNPVPTDTQAPDGSQPPAQQTPSPVKAPPARPAMNINHVGLERV